MRVLVWQVHGGWMDAFARGPHSYLLPVDAAGAGGRGARDWPATVDVPEAELADADIDVVVLQRLEELELTERLTRRRIGRDLPAVFVEHNTPRDNVPESRHPLADRDDLVIAHVTHFNALFWDVGSTPSTVIEHGVVDYGALWTGELRRMAAVINEPVRRGRVTGSDLLGGLSGAAPIDVFGMRAEGLASSLGVSTDRVAAAGDLAIPALYREAGRRRLYLHPNRWTSLGLALLEAMTAGMPVVAVDATDVRRAVPPEAGTVSTDPAELAAGARRLLDDHAEAVAAGAAARAWALEHFGLSRFLAEWDGLLAETVEAPARRSRLRIA